jgi:hypothetical protein
VAAFALLAGCSSVSHVIADHWPRALGGLPEGVPPRLENPPEYMSVNDRPPPRDTKQLTPTERAKAEAEIAASRSQTTAQGAETKVQSPANLPPIR